MRKLFLGILICCLFGCAELAPLGSPEVIGGEEDVCAFVDCGTERYCQDYWGVPVCVFYREQEPRCELACPSYSECVTGRCVESDLSGDICEFDEVCRTIEYCISGHCTELGCNPGETRSCYYGPSGTIGIGECRGGYHLCTDEGLFSEECIGQVLPAPDEGFLACNGHDDNCDGITDAGGVEAVDIIFAFDLSGSMSDETIAVAEAIRRLSLLYNHPSVQLGLVVFPDPAPGGGFSYVPRTAIPLTDYIDFSFQIGFLTWMGSTSSGNEASWDVPVLIANNLQPDIDLRPEAKHVVIMFTDEEGQTYFDSSDLGLGPQRNNEEEMCRVISRENLLLYVVTDVGEAVSHYNSSTGSYEDFIIDETFDDCATIFPLSEDPQDMVDNLSDIADLVCVEE